MKDLPIYNDWYYLEPLVSLTRLYNKNKPSTKGHKKSDWFQGIIPVVETLGDSSQTHLQKYDIYCVKTKKLIKKEKLVVINRTLSGPPAGGLNDIPAGLMPCNNLTMSYALNACFGYFLGDKLLAFFEVLQAFVLLKAVCHAGF